MADEEITIEHLENSHLQMSMHLDGPRGKNGWFADIHRSVEFPRLTRKVTYRRATRSADVEWLVDDVVVGKNLADVLPALNGPEKPSPRKQALDAMKKRLDSE